MAREPRGVERSRERHLAILTAIENGEAPTQRALAQRVGVAVGLTNLYLKRLATKGYIKIAEFPRKPYAGKRLRYLVTAKGLAEKTRLTYEYMERSLTLYRLARQTLREALTPVVRAGERRVALYGSGEAAELAYLTLRELGLEPVGVFADEPAGTFLGVAIRPVRELAQAPIDRVVLATFDKPKLRLPALLALGIPAEKIITLHGVRKTNGLA